MLSISKIVLTLAVVVTLASARPRSKDEKNIAMACANSFPGMESCPKHMKACADKIGEDCYDPYSCLDCVVKVSPICHGCSYVVQTTEQFPTGTYNPSLSNCIKNHSNGQDQFCAFHCSSLTYPYGQCMTRRGCYCSWTNNVDEAFSDILSNEETGGLLELMKTGGIERRGWKLLYSADGTPSNLFSAADFHQEVDGKNNTLTIIKLVNNGDLNTYVFGGYVSKPWDVESGYVSDDKAFIFSLVNTNTLPYVHPVFPGGENAMYCHAEHGPSFGRYDLRIRADGQGTSDFGRDYDPDFLVAGTDQAKSYLAGRPNFNLGAIAVYTFDN